MADSFRVQDPFTPNDFADVILRSGDNHDFYVVKALLSMASSVFKDMFSLPQQQPPAEARTESDLPVVNITETGPVTDILLRYAYPVVTPDVPSVELAFDVLVTARKYDMDCALQGAKRVIRDLCSSDDSRILRAFALSFDNKLKDEIQLAARQSLRFPLSSISSIHVLDSIPGKAVLNLFEYHNKVGESIKGVVFSEVSKLLADAIDGIECKICSTKRYYLGGRYISLPSWWTDICQKLESAKFTGITGPLSNEVFLQSVLPTSCDHCKLRIWNFGVDRFAGIVRMEMEKAASKVASVT